MLCITTYMFVKLKMCLLIYNIAGWDVVFNKICTNEPATAICDIFNNIFCPAAKYVEMYIKHVASCCRRCGRCPLQSCLARAKFADFTEFFFCVTRMLVPISDFMTCAVYHFWEIVGNNCASGKTYWSQYCHSWKQTNISCHTMYEGIYNFGWNDIIYQLGTYKYLNDMMSLLYWISLGTITKLRIILSYIYHPKYLHTVCFGDGLSIFLYIRIWLTIISCCCVDYV